MRNTLILITLLLLTACGSKSTDVPQPVVPPPVVPPAPGKSTLLLPAADLVCYTGELVSATQTNVTFNWTAASDADSYEIIVKNLSTGAEAARQNVANTQATHIILNTNVPYSWYVIARSAKSTVATNSDVYRFYNARQGDTNFAPYPSQLISPQNGANITTPTVDLVWKGSSVSNNIVGYDVYMGRTDIPELIKSNIKDMHLDGLTVLANTRYYWRVVAKDDKGNTAASDLNIFTVN